MASKKSYSDEVWNMLHLVWESSPKITWQALADQVSEKLGREVPASSVIRRRAISEGWKKNISSLVGKDAQSLNDEIEKQGGHKNSHDNDPVKSDTSKNDSECQNDIKNDNQKSKKSKTKDNDIIVFDKESAGREKLIHDIKERKLTAAKVVRKTRNNLAKLSHFITDTLDSLGGVRDELQSMDVMTAGEAEINAIKFKMSVTSQMIEQNLKQSITIANVARTEAMFWGLEVEDLKDQSEQEAKRTAVMNQSTAKLEEAKRQMKEKKKEAFKRQLEYIEMGKEIEENGQ